MPQSPYLIVNTATVPNLSVSVDKSGQFSYFNRADNAWHQVSDQASIDEIKAAMPNALFVPGRSTPPPPPPLPALVDRMETLPPRDQPSPEVPTKLALSLPVRRRKKAPASASATPPARIRRQRSEHVKRPPNSFILFRSANLDAIRSEAVTQGQSISQRASAMWKNAPDSVRASFEQQAREEKEKHRQQHPDYRFNPNKRRTEA